MFIKYTVLVNFYIDSWLYPALPQVWLPQGQWLCLCRSIGVAWYLEETTAEPLAQSRDDRRDLGAYKINTDS